MPIGTGLEKCSYLIWLLYTVPFAFSSHGHCIRIEIRHLSVRI